MFKREVDLIAVGSGLGMLTIRPRELGLPRENSIIVYALPFNWLLL